MEIHYAKVKAFISSALMTAQNKLSRLLNIGDYGHGSVVDSQCEVHGWTWNQIYTALLSAFLSQSLTLKSKTQNGDTDEHLT